jgi:hypothetical protein
MAVTIFQKPRTPIRLSLAARARSAIISDRETLYFLHPSETLK